MWPFRAKQPATRAPGPETKAPYPFGFLPDTIPGGQYPPAADVWSGFNANYLPGAWPLGIPNVDSRGILDQTGQVQPLPETLTSQLLLSNKTRYNEFNGHSFVKARLPDPGAPQWTFESLGLVEFTPIGTGILNQGELRPLEGAPLFPTLAVPVQGLGGIVQGGIRHVPLMNNPLATATDQITSL
jgi:hypothetical protein